MNNNHGINNNNHGRWCVRWECSAENLFCLGEQQLTVTDAHKLAPPSTRRLNPEISIDHHPTGSPDCGCCHWFRKQRRQRLVGDTGARGDTYGVCGTSRRPRAGCAPPRRQLARGVWTAAPQRRRRYLFLLALCSAAYAGVARRCEGIVASHAASNAWAPQQARATGATRQVVSNRDGTTSTIYRSSTRFSR